MVWCTGPESPSTASSPDFEHLCLETSAAIILPLPHIPRSPSWFVFLNTHTLETSMGNGEKSKVSLPPPLMQHLWLSRVRGSVSVRAVYQVWILYTAQTVRETPRQHSCLNTSPAAAGPVPTSNPVLTQSWGCLGGKRSGLQAAFSQQGPQFPAWKILEPILSSSKSYISRNISFKCGGIWDRF